jgi:hypothetical protein
LNNNLKWIVQGYKYVEVEISSYYLIKSPQLLYYKTAKNRGGGLKYHSNYGVSVVLGAGELR